MARRRPVTDTRCDESDRGVIVKNATDRERGAIRKADEDDRTRGITIQMPQENNSQIGPLDIFIYQQNANGGFMINNQFISSSGIKNNQKDLTAAIPEILKSSEVKDKEIVWVTVIALVVFERRFHI